MDRPEHHPGTEPRAFSVNDLTGLYERRFDADEMVRKTILWETLCEDFFIRYVTPDDTVLDLGAGSCEFINAIRCRRKIAVDLNPDITRYAMDAQVLITSSENLSELGQGSVDVVFTSNFFEHLPTKRSLLRTLAECRRVLRPTGRLLVIMPNLRYLPGRYWDYFDHHLPLTHLSLVEALNLAGFDVDEVVPRFLPYTVKDAPIAARRWVIRAYLRARLVWPVFGRQMFVVARSGALSGG
ncbi:MAG: class I SAM-dependent methyltransferase [Micromonosporaceae bacterium]|nr:class I SAM-dependent methyltransferase [Micromonosporaceae bacterium]